MVDVLVIDDETDICEIIRELLEDADFSVKTACDADSARVLVNTHSPSLLICDISMPGRSGLEFLQEMREKGIPCGVVMLTAHAESENIIHALQLGAIDYIVKPFDSAELMKKVPAWIEIGKRIKSLRDTAKKSPQLLETQLRMIELFRIQPLRKSAAA